MDADEGDGSAEAGNKQRCQGRRVVEMYAIAGERDRLDPGRANTTVFWPVWGAMAMKPRIPKACSTA